MVPSKKKILKDLDALVATNTGVYERCKAAFDDPARSLAERRQAAFLARDALEQSLTYGRLAEQLRAGLIDRSNAVFREIYR